MDAGALAFAADNLARFFKEGDLLSFVFSLANVIGLTVAFAALDFFAPVAVGFLTTFLTGMISPKILVAIKLRLSIIRYYQNETNFKRSIFYLYLFSANELAQCGFYPRKAHKPLDLGDSGGLSLAPR